MITPHITFLCTSTRDTIDGLLLFHFNSCTTTRGGVGEGTEAERDGTLLGMRRDGRGEKREEEEEEEEGGVMEPKVLLLPPPPPPPHSRMSYSPLPCQSI